MNVSLTQRAGTSLWDRFFLLLLSKMTNTHSKRIIFLTSLYCRVVRLEQMRDDAIGKLNNLLQLARRDQALRFPAAIQGMVWDIDGLRSQISQEMSQPEWNANKARELSEQLVAASPQWVRYGELDDMVHDVMAMMQDIFRQVRSGEMAVA